MNVCVYTYVCVYVYESCIQIQHIVMPFKLYFLHKLINVFTTILLNLFISMSNYLLFIYNFNQVITDNMFLCLKLFSFMDTLCILSKL